MGLEGFKKFFGGKKEEEVLAQRQEPVMSNATPAQTPTGLGIEVHNVDGGTPLGEDPKLDAAVDDVVITEEPVETAPSARALSGTQDPTTTYIPPGSPGYKRVEATMPTLDEHRAKRGAVGVEPEEPVAPAMAMKMTGTDGVPVMRDATATPPTTTPEIARMPGAAGSEITGGHIPEGWGKAPEAPVTEALGKTPAPASKEAEIVNLDKFRESAKTAPEGTPLKDRIKEATISNEAAVAMMSGVVEDIVETTTAPTTRDKKNAPTISTTPPSASESVSRDMGDGRIEPTFDASPKMRAMVLDTDPQVKMLKEQKAKGSITPEQYHKEIQKLKDTAPLVDVPTKTPEERAEQAVQQEGEVKLNKAVENVKEGDVSFIDPEYLKLKKEGKDEEAEVMKKAGHGKVLSGAAKDSVVKAQLKDQEAIITKAKESPETQEITSEILNEALGGESSFERFRFSDEFKGHIEAMLAELDASISVGSVMDIFDSLADAYLMDDDAKLARQEGELDKLFKKHKGQNNIFRRLFYKELWLGTMKNTQAQQQEAVSVTNAPEVPAQAPETQEAVPASTLEQHTNAIAVVRERGNEAASASSLELAELSVAKAESLGVAKALKGMVAGIATGAVGFGGAAATTMALGGAIGGLTIGTAAVAAAAVGGAAGLVIAGVVMAATLLVKKKDK